MTITPQQRMQVFMLYPNAVVKTVHPRHDRIKVYEYIEASGFDAFYWFRIGQLILRSIDQLTEDEKRGLAKVLIVGVSVSFNSEELMKYGGEAATAFLENPTMIPMIGADYLRSIGIALPYMGVDLFEEGIAVKNDYKS